MTNWAVEVEIKDPEAPYRRNLSNSKRELERLTRKLLTELIARNAPLPKGGGFPEAVIRRVGQNDLIIQENRVVIRLSWPGICVITGFHDRGAVFSITSFSVVYNILRSWDTRSWGALGGGQLGKGQWWYFQDPTVFQTFRDGTGENYMTVSRDARCGGGPLQASDFQGFIAYPKKEQEAQK